MRNQTAPGGAARSSARALPSPDDLLADTWRTLVRAVADSRHAFRWPALATIAADGGPDVRTVVLRNASEALRRLELHTDARSAKLAQLAARPQAMLLFHDARRRLQLRVAVQVAHGDDEARRSAAWAMLSPAARRLYEIGPAPGRRIGEAQAEALRAFTAGQGDDTAGPAEDEAGSAFARFVLLDCTVASIDRLDLSSDGQLRSRHVHEAGGWRHEWLAP